MNETKEIKATKDAHSLIEADKPIEIMVDDIYQDIRRAALPPGWTLHERDDDQYNQFPRRATGKIYLTDIDSYIDYINRHKTEGSTSIYCLADYEAGRIKFSAVINDHAGTDSPFHNAGWRDHIATYEPEKSVEWKRWYGNHKNVMNQTEFATFIEENLRDVASVDGMPTGQQILEMALSFEANQDSRFKSAIRLQNGGVQINLVQDDDAQTISKMQMFDKISIGIPVLWNGPAYRIDARLRYRARDSKLVFWYEMIRPDKVFEDASKVMIEYIKEKTQVYFYHGGLVIDK